MAGSMTALKKDLRKRIRLILSELSDTAAASQTSNATKTLLSMPEYKAAQRVSVYLSMPCGEISTSDIVDDALKQGKKVFIPHTYKTNTPKAGQPQSIMDMLELKSMGDFTSLKRDRWGIPTLDEDSILSRANSFGGFGVTDGILDQSSESKGGLDLIIMPGMAFDSAFGRLGHGKGFYDYFLHRCRCASNMPFRVGLSLNEQLLLPTDLVPMDASDFRLDALVLGNGELHRSEK
ncbi:5-formyltetrahydrofolate cyclo-ligase-like protein [Polyplosphaeria fusca]|uniref:5-formyltetrahydrofolate cyclo-ligase n=1 Tax=Polyplosphaeria fusca TaxID=682080 RepID=A0A9P4QSF1_9PLEO|nr:5-formyltetrahydrofolate cyclo-ligase-like protein [Polyplosphaeria fusca]